MQEEHITEIIFYHLTLERKTVGINNIGIVTIVFKKLRE